MDPSKLEKLLLKAKHSKWTPYIGLAAFAVVAQISQHWMTKPTHPLDSEIVASIDTTLPVGHTLVPLEIRNKDQIAEMSEQMIVGDIYSLKDLNQPELILVNARIVRAPHNPNVYAAIVKKDFVKMIVHHSDDVFVAIKNPNERGASFVPHKSKAKKLNIHVFYGDQ